MGEPGGISQLFSDPNFLGLLAGVGARLDPEGVGGAIGVPAQQLIQGQAAQKALGEQEKRRSALTTLAASSLLPDNDPRKNDFLNRAISYLGGMTAPDKEGVTGVKVGPGGNYLLDITPPKAPINAEGPYSQETPITTNAPATTVTPTPTPTRQRSRVSDIVPFY